MPWETLRPVLLGLTARQPSPLVAYPDPRVPGPRRTPFRLRLRAWAEPVAERLHREFGDEVVLTVGNFGYPERRWVDELGRPLAGPPTAVRRAAPLADPGHLGVEVVGDLVVVAGHDAVGDLRLTTAGPGAVEVVRLAPEVVDPDTGATVGGPLVFGHAEPAAPRLTVRPGMAAAVRLTIGTASRSPGLGYAVPAGSWAVRIHLTLAGGRSLRAPLLPIEILAPAALR